MKHHIIFDLAAFKLPGTSMVLAGLFGDPSVRLRGIIVRRWKSLAMGDENEILQSTCELAASMDEQLLDYKPKPAINAEDFLAVVRKKLAVAVPMGRSYDHPNHARIKAFCIRVERDAISTWKAKNFDQAQTYLSLNPVERSPYQKLVLEKHFAPTPGEFLLWQTCTTRSKFMESFAIVTGDGEH